MMVGRDWVESMTRVALMKARPDADIQDIDDAVQTAADLVFGNRAVKLAMRAGKVPKRILLPVLKRVLKKMGKTYPRDSRP